VVVGVAGQVVDGGPVAQVDVVDHAQPLELVEEAVHRRLVDVGLGRLHPGGQRLGRHVAADAEERLEDGPPARRDPPAAGPQEGEDRVGLLANQHGRSVVPAR